jgi:hypothetical protein
MYLLDTDVLIDIQRKYAPALTWFATLTELLAVPDLVVMELIQDAQNARQVRQALKLVAPLPVVWPTAADCQRALTDFIDYVSAAAFRRTNRPSCCQLTFCRGSGAALLVLNRGFIHGWSYVGNLDTEWLAARL